VLSATRSLVCTIDPRSRSVARALVDHPEQTVVVFIDLDGFKDVNDTYGHEVGDGVLIAIAERLRESVRPDDMVGRFGGDEFVLVLQDDGLDDEAIVERLDSAISPPITWDGGSWRPAVSIGVARPHPGDDIATVVRNADREMFAVKRQRKLRRA
jgi:diguanylate cyclase